MKKLIVGLMLMFVVGCNRTPDIMRTGSICVPPPSANNYKTNDFVDVKQELVDRLSVELSKETKRYIVRDSQMKIADCGATDYQLIIAINNVELDNRQYANPWTGQRSTNRHYSMGISWMLNSKENNTLKSGSNNESGTDISKIVSKQGDHIIDNIKKVESK